MNETNIFTANPEDCLICKLVIGFLVSPLILIIGVATFQALAG